MQLDSAMRVIRVLIDGKPNTRISRTRYARSSTEIDVPHQKQPGDTLSTRVRYRGFTRDGLIIGDNQYGDRTVFADNWPDRAHLWLASDDRPADKATVAFHVQAPIGQQVIANGVLQSIDTLPYGNAVWHYRLDTPIPVYNMVVGMGRLARSPPPPSRLRREVRAAFRVGVPAGLGLCRRRPVPPRGRHGGLLQRAVRAIPVPGIGARRVEHPLRRDGERHRHLLRPEALPGQETGGAAGGARDRAPMVRRCRHAAGVASPLAVGGLRHLSGRSVERSRRRRQRLPREHEEGGG